MSFSKREVGIIDDCVKGRCEVTRVRLPPPSGANVGKVRSANGRDFLFYKRRGEIVLYVREEPDNDQFRRLRELRGRMRSIAGDTSQHTFHDDISEIDAATGFAQHRRVLDLSIDELIAYIEGRLATVQA